MAKKQTRTTAKAPAKTKVALRKTALKDLDVRRADEIKSGTYSTGSRR